jgi:hypothetical protein
VEIRSNREGNSRERLKVTTSISYSSCIWLVVTAIGNISRLSKTFRFNYFFGKEIGSNREGGFQIERPSPSSYIWLSSQRLAYLTIEHSFSLRLVLYVGKDNEEIELLGFQSSVTTSISYSSYIWLVVTAIGNISRLSKAFRFI